MIKKHTIYKKDNWNMMTIEVQGRKIVLREISDEWGEETHDFLSRPKERFETEAEWEEIMNAFREV
jgi:hypothetical protein